MTKTTKWLDIICRYFICLLMLIYGTVKVFNGQFYTDCYWKDMTLAQLDGVKLVWSLYSYSPTYETLLGIMEVSIGLLVLFKRTTRLGVLLFVPIITNLLILNIAFSIGALPSVVPLFVAGIILFAIHFKSYKNYFLQKESADDTTPPKRSHLIAKLVLITIGFGLAALLVYNNKFKFQQDGGIKGGWMVQGYPELKTLYFEKGHMCVLKDSKDSLFFADYQTTPAKTITMLGFSNPLLNWQDLTYVINQDTLSVIKNRKKIILLRKM